MSITPQQYDVLMKPLNGTRVATRRQGGKDLSYLAAYDVRAHLIRVFGFGNFDVETLEYHHVNDREYTRDGKEMVEVSYSARVQLTVRAPDGSHISTNSECAVGSAIGPATQYGELADNGLKTAVSDAMKRAALSWGTAFGLGLYADGSKAEVVRGTVHPPKGWEPEPTPEAAQERLERSLGATEIKGDE